METAELFRKFLEDNIAKEKSDLIDLLHSIGHDGLPSNVTARLKKIKDLEASLAQHSRRKKKVKKDESEQLAIN